MPKKQVLPPLRGATNAGPYVQTPGDANPPEGLRNVRPRRPGSGRAQMAVRPGMETIFSSDQVSPVQAMAVIGRSTGVSGYVTGTGQSVRNGLSVSAGPMAGQFVVLDPDWSVRAVFRDSRGTGLAALTPPLGHDGNSVCWNPANPDIGYGLVLGRDTAASTQDVAIFGINRLDLTTGTITHQTWGLDTNTSYAAGSYPTMPASGQVDLFANKMVCHGPYLFVAVREYIYVFRADNLTYLKRHAGDWADEIQSIEVITFGSKDYLMVLAEGATARTGPVVMDAGPSPITYYGWFYRAGILKYEIQYLNTAKDPVAGGSTALVRKAMPMGLESGDSGYEDHRSFRFSEWSLQRPRGCLPWDLAMEVDSSGNVWAYAVRTNQGFDFDGTNVPDGSVAYVSACRANLTAAFRSTIETFIDPDNPTDDYGFDFDVGGWEADTNSLRKAHNWHTEGYLNDIPNAVINGGKHDPHYPGESPSLLAIAVDTQRGRCFVGGRRPSPSQVLPNVYCLRSNDGVRLWDTDLKGLVQQNALAVDPTSGNVVCGFNRNTGWEGDPGSQSIFVAELDATTGAVVRWFDLGDTVILNSYADGINVIPSCYDVAVNPRGQVLLALGPSVYDT